MVTAARFRRLCLGFAGAREVPHFDRAAFRTARRIFATLAADARTANLRLSPEQQALVQREKPAAYAPIAGAWGRQGFTTVTHARVDLASLTDALTWAHELASVAPTRRRARPRGP